MANENPERERQHAKRPVKDFNFFWPDDDETRLNAKRTLKLSFRKNATDMKKPHSALLTLALLSTTTLAALGQTAAKPMKITDPKLGTVKYGIETVEYWLERMKPGDKNRAQKIDRDLLKVIERFKRVRGANPEQSKEVVRRIQAAAKELQAKASNVSSKQATTNDSATQAKASDMVTPNADLPEVDATKTPPPKTPESAQAKIQKLQDKYHKDFVVPKLYFKDELTADLVDSFTNDVKKLRAEVAKDLPSVRLISKTHRSARYLLNLLENETERNILRNTEQAIMLIDGKMKFVASYLAKQATLDRTDDAYVFENEKLVSKNEEQFASMSRTLEQAIRFQTELGISDTYTATKQKFDADLKKWRSMASSTTKGRQLPKDIGDDKLRNIAAEVLRNKKYGVGKIERLIVNAKIRPGDRIEHKVFAGKLETIVRVWEEYQVATVEVEKGKHYLYFNTLRKFTRAPRTTPVNEWILSKRIKSGEILSSNL